jgi:hypothetical protein
MPAAAPLPRIPSVLTLESADDLLTGPGCPACRYVSEASDRYLRWFALEAHADPVTITRLCGSLGMCGRHTRLLMAQPGAAVRLTAVYGYLVTSARDRLAGRATPVASCPACEHDEAAAGPLVAEPGSYACTACLAASVAERNYLARVMSVSDDELADPDLLLCPGHLADAALLAGNSPRLTALLLWQANCHTVSLTEAGRKAAKAAESAPAASASRDLRGLPRPARSSQLHAR